MSAIVFLSCVIVVLALAALLRNFLQLRRSLEFAQRYDVTIKKGRYESLPIYEYILHHVHIVIVASTATILFVSVVLALTIFSAEHQFQPSSFFELLEVVLSLLTVLLVIHTAFIACYESSNPDERKMNDPNIQSGLRDFRVRLWGSALRLFVFIVFMIFMMMAREVLLVFASS